MPGITRHDEPLICGPLSTLSQHEVNCTPLFIDSAVEVTPSLTYSLYPLAHLGPARAAALAGDTAKSRQAYQDFSALWMEADADIPILQEARREYEKLK